MDIIFQLGKPVDSLLSQLLSGQVKCAQVGWCQASGFHEHEKFTSDKVSLFKNVLYAICKTGILNEIFLNAPSTRHQAVHHPVLNQKPVRIESYRKLRRLSTQPYSFSDSTAGHVGCVAQEYCAIMLHLKSLIPSSITYLVNTSGPSSVLAHDSRFSSGIGSSLNEKHSISVTQWFSS